MAGFELTSDAFADGDRIPARHSGEGEDRSPPLAWTAPPEGTRSLALVVEDPDAPGGTFDHWLAWGIDPGRGRLGEGEPAPYSGNNGFGVDGYRGPMPPPGHGPHRYRFLLHALDAEIDLPSGVGRAELDAALEGHVLATAELVGTYERP
ncbi:MAG TPA: YbhB/YbcL family Raf kinase inhibitor-like protein [Capillimicrobium sp.]|nr:YbhB/YbcL family Raf kinase inhibitor-like protein [Capillimicrobium sp.]